jgi:hypothetical protein
LICLFELLDDSFQGPQPLELRSLGSIQVAKVSLDGVPQLWPYSYRLLSLTDLLLGLGERC